MNKFFKKKDKKKTEEVVNENQDIQFMIDDENDLADTITTLTIDDDISEQQSIDKTVVFTSNESEAEETVKEEKIDDLDDDSEYEYVTVHYGRNACVLALVFVLVGVFASYLIFSNSLSKTIRENLENNGYMITNMSTATAEDIKEGKTAYIRGQLVTGTYVEIDTSAATATSSDILSGYTAYVNGVKITGSIPTYNGSNLITPSTADYKINKGYYIPSDITVVGSGELTSSNIKKGVKIFGVLGTYEGN